MPGTCGVGQPVWQPAYRYRNRIAGIGIGNGNGKGGNLLPLCVALAAGVGNGRRAVGRRRDARRRYGDGKGRRNIRVHAVVGGDGSRVVFHHRIGIHRAANLPGTCGVGQPVWQPAYRYRNRIAGVGIGNGDGKGGDGIPLRVALAAGVSNGRRAVGRRRLRLGRRLVARCRYRDGKGRRNIRVHAIVGGDGYRVVAHRRPRPYRAAHLPRRRIVRQAERQAVHPHRRRILRIRNRDGKGGNLRPLRVALAAGVGDDRRAVGRRRRGRTVIVRISQPQRNHAGRGIAAVRRQRVARRRSGYRVVHIPVGFRIVHARYRDGIGNIPGAAVDRYIVARAFVHRNLRRRHAAFCAVLAGERYDGVRQRFRSQPHRESSGSAGLGSAPARFAPARRGNQAALPHYRDPELPRGLIAVAVGSRPGIEGSGLRCRRRTADAPHPVVAEDYAVGQRRRQGVVNAALPARCAGQRECGNGAVLHPGFVAYRVGENRPRPGIDGYLESSRNRIAVLVGGRPGVLGSSHRHRRRAADAMAGRIPRYAARQRRRQRITDRAAAAAGRRQIKPFNPFVLRPHPIRRRHTERQRRNRRRLSSYRIRNRDAESQPRHIAQPVLNLPGVPRGAHCGGGSAAQLDLVRRHYAPGNSARQRRRNLIAHIRLIPVQVAVLYEPQRVHGARAGVQPAAHRQVHRRNRLPRLPNPIGRAAAAETHRIRHDLHRGAAVAAAANGEPVIGARALYPQRNRLPAFAMRPAVIGVDGIRVSLRAAAQCDCDGALETRQTPGSRRRQVIAVPRRAAGRQRNAGQGMVGSYAGGGNGESNPVAFVHLQAVGVGVAVAVIAADGDGNAAAAGLRGDISRRQRGG